MLQFCDDDEFGSFIFSIQTELLLYVCTYMKRYIIKNIKQKDRRNIAVKFYI